ncbi:MAG: DUF3667 domain-containing protein [Gammaproteobacteria bacterium]|nr:DUF3667 domain-containing protein [Gammaproteobacteria bacterium]
MSDSPSHCGNCAVPLTGPFCAQCGQSAHESARSMHALFHDGWHSLTHLDGRLWRTLGLLLWKPGEVSRQFIANRRASFLPPFRLYLVLSLLFFGLFSTTRNEDIMRVQFTVSERETVCQDLKVRPQWLAERMRATCRKALADEGASLRDAFVASLPRAMFLFLPLIAAGMLLLYWRPRRWYVEHLVFFLHNHSAAFLVGSAVALVQLAARAWPALSAVASFTVAGMFCWLAVYLFLAMRRFYGQGRRRTFAKLLVISLFYAMSMVLMVGLTALYSALTL